MRKSKLVLVAPLLLAAPAEASNWWITPSTPGMNAPGQFTLGLGAEATFVQMPRFRYGDRFASSGFNPSLGPVFDERPREIAAMPHIEASFGMPSGFFGTPADVFARFSYYRATSKFGGTFLRTSADTMVFPFVGPLQFPSFAGTGVDLVFDRPLNVDIRRSLASYDGSIGLRIQRQYGSLSLSPWIDFGFQRLTLADRISLTYGTSLIFPVPTGGPTQADIDGDYYRLGVGVAASYPLGPAWSWFGSVYGSLDVVHASLSASSTFFNFDAMFGNHQTLSVVVSDRRTTVSGRVAVRSGIAYAVFSNVTIVAGGGIQYIGAVPNVVYPSHANFNAGQHNNGTVPARIGFTGQFNYSAGMGVKIAF